MDNALLIALVLVYAAAIVLTGVTAIQGLTLRHRAEELKNTELEYKAETAVSASKHTCTNSLRAYAVSINMRASNMLTNLIRPRFRIYTLRGSCETDGSEAQPRFVSFQHPYWLVIDGTRSAGTLVNDVFSGAIHYLMLSGHVCRVRVATPEENQKIRDNMREKNEFSRMRSAKILVVAADTDIASGECDLPHIHPFVSSAAESWDRFVPNRAAQEENPSDRTVAHIWGYGISNLRALEA